MIITIDGPAGSGKSTVAEILAQKLGYIHFNSGSLHRAMTAYIIYNNIDLDDVKTGKIQLKLKMKYSAGVQNVLVNNSDMTSHLRDNEVSILTPKVSVIPNVRNEVDNCQRAFASKHNIVAEGRDMGSFVFPNAEYKFYLDCNPTERARRRFNEEKLKNPNITLEEIRDQIIARDNADKAKTIAPLVVPRDACIIDSSNLTIDEVVSKMEKVIKSTTKK